ncbi:MAG: GTPase [Planctomycetota bacterium]
MPANLTPEYFKAEEWYRSASTNDEKLLAIEQMLRVMPKHKGTDHLRADLRRKLSKLKELATQKKTGRQADIFYIPRGGSGQIAFLGLPNSGKSSILDALTNAKVHVADFPFATGAPVPGMMEFEDVQIQLIDMPPITADFLAPGQVGTYRNCDVIGIVIDLSDDIDQQMKTLLDFLDSKQLLINELTGSVDDNGNRLGKRAFCICTKCDIAGDDALEKVKGLGRDGFEYLAVSFETGENVDKLSEFFFKMCKIIRVYAKPPGKKPDMDEPFTLSAGSTVMDLATAIHRELAEKLKYARIWGTGVYDGQNTQRTHVLNDKDIIELHFS